MIGGLKSPRHTIAQKKPWSSLQLRQHENDQEPRTIKSPLLLELDLTFYFFYYQEPGTIGSPRLPELDFAFNFLWPGARDNWEPSTFGAGPIPQPDLKSTPASKPACTRVAQSWGLFGFGIWNSKQSFYLYSFSVKQIQFKLWKRVQIDLKVKVQDCSSWN